jgi:hypothetical protein
MKVFDLNSYSNYESRQRFRFHGSQRKQKLSAPRSSLDSSSWSMEASLPVVFGVASVDAIVESPVVCDWKHDGGFY